MSNKKSRIRKKTRSVYDIQGLRIAMGNRIAQNFRSKLGLDKENEDIDESEAKDILRKLELRYKRITDGIALSDLSRRRTYEYDGVIEDQAELFMINHYLRLCEQEKEMFTDLKHEVREFEIWHEFFNDVKGIGPAMASVMISEFDPHEGTYVSSFWKYAGLDTVDTWHKVKTKGKELDRPSVETPPSEAEISEDGQEATLNGSKWEKKRIARSKRTQHLREIEYTNSDGEKDTRLGLTFNPFLHDKLLGVAGECLIRAGGHYKDVYDDYRHRLDNEAEHDSKSDAHKHRMGVRYMVKQMVKDLYLAWRPIEGLPTHDPYRVEKLNKEPHGERK